MGDNQISKGKKNRRDFMSGLRVGGNGNMSDQVGERGREGKN